VASWRTTSVFFRGSGQLTHAVVPIDTWVSCGSTQPDPTAAPCRSGIPVTTRAAGEMPSSAATSGATVAMTDPEGTSGGSFAASTPARASSVASYSRRSSRRLSVSQAAVIDMCEAAGTPVKRIER
jgi:hypothetical protein